MTSVSLLRSSKSWLKYKRYSLSVSRWPRMSQRRPRRRWLLRTRKFSLLVVKLAQLVAYFKLQRSKKTVYTNGSLYRSRRQSVQSRGSSRPFRKLLLLVPYNLSRTFQPLVTYQISLQIRVQTPVPQIPLRQYKLTRLASFLSPRLI